MADYSTDRVRRFRAHHSGSGNNQHQRCLSETCREKQDLEKSAQAAIEARAVLDFCRDNGIAWDTLPPDELKALRKAARFKLESIEWLAAEYQVDFAIRMEAKYVYQAIMDGVKPG